jgi:hypothetical protein
VADVAERDKKRPGRPTLDLGVNRVLISVRIHPKTLEAIKAEMKSSGLSMGRMLDRLFE